MKDDAIEFGVTVGAILVGLVLAKLLSNMLEKAGVPIAGGDPVPVPVS